ncbi:MAG TPA: hypothetical protein VF116_17270 [Ktedonobacterales bacterium]
MSPSRLPGRAPEQRATIRLKDLALSDRESVFRTPRSGDWAVLALLVVGLAGCGLFTWYRLGPQHDHIGRAIFFGTLLLCAFWTATVYTFKLSLCACVGPHGVSVVRGPWRTELPWREVARMTERMQPSGGQRYRWLVVFARDGRRLQIREDLVNDYARFRLEVFERYALWRDHGGTLGAAGAGPFVTRETLSAQVSWWLVLALFVLLPGLYFALVLPETGLIGPVLIVLASLCALLSLRSLLRRHTFTIDAKAIAAQRPGRSTVLPWREVARVDRTRHRHNPLVRLAIAVAGAGIALATRTDQRVQIFDWRPRVPEYLTLRGAGHLVRIALHRLPRPDDLLAWIEFYESVGRKATARETGVHRTGAPASQSQPQPERAPITVDLSAPSSPPAPTSVASAPSDPWAMPTAEVPSLAANGSVSPNGDDAWLRDEPDNSTQETVEMARTASPTSDPGAEAGSGHERGGRSHPSSSRAAQPPQRQTPTAEPAPAEQRFIAESAPRGWGAAAWQPPQQPSEPQQSSEEREWEAALDLPDETEPDQQPTDLSADLAASFATWRTDPRWQPPQLPRFGPPPPDPGEPEQREDSGAFTQDDFLR